MRLDDFVESRRVKRFTSLCRAGEHLFIFRRGFFRFAGGTKRACRSFDCNGRILVLHSLVRCVNCIGRLSIGQRDFRAQQI
jgi:hypothetical protein